MRLITERSSCNSCSGPRTAAPACAVYTLHAEAHQALLLLTRQGMKWKVALLYIIAKPGDVTYTMDPLDAGSSHIVMYVYACREWSRTASAASDASAGALLLSRDLPSAWQPAAFHNGPRQASSQPAHAVRCTALSSHAVALTSTAPLSGHKAQDGCHSYVDLPLCHCHRDRLCTQAWLLYPATCIRLLGPS